MSEDKNYVEIPKGIMETRNIDALRRELINEIASNNMLRDRINKMFDEEKFLKQKIENYEGIIKIAREHIADIHLGYEKYLENICKIKVSPLDILERIERRPGDSYIRRLLSKENEIIINFRIPEKGIVLYKDENK